MFNGKMFKDDDAYMLFVMIIGFIVLIAKL